MSWKFSEVEKFMSGSKRMFPSQGKCDFRDHLCMLDADGSDEQIEAFLEKTIVYVWGSDGVPTGPLKMTNLKEAIPYMFHLISVGVLSEGNKMVVLTSEPFYDSEEKERLEGIYDRILKYLKKCKRKKQSSSFKEASECLLCFPNGTVKDNWETRCGFIMYERLKEDLKMDFKSASKGLHDFFHTEVRKKLLDFAYQEGVDLQHPRLKKCQEQLLEFEKQENTIINWEA